VIDLTQDVVGKMQAIDLPATLRGDRPAAVGEILIVSFEEAVVDSVPVQHGTVICAEYDAVGITQEEAARAVRLAPELGDASRDVDVEVGAAIEQRAHPGQVLGVAPHVCADEGGARGSAAD
jgi:hypothetical protein